VPPAPASLVGTSLEAPDCRDKEVDMNRLSARLPKNAMNRLSARLPRNPIRRASRAPLVAFGVLASSAAAAAAFVWSRRDRQTARLVRDVMIGNVLTIEADRPLREAAQMMRDGNVGVLPVVDNGQLRGIVTDRDIVVRAIADGVDLATARVGDCATWNIVCARADSTIGEAMEVMGDSQIGRLPVVDADNRVIGIVTLSSLALRSPRQGEALETAQEVSKRSSRAA
jgi:CBS domain-containing protein